MLKVRFVEGSAEDYSITYDCEWPVTPRVGEFISVTSGTGQTLDWKITRVCHVVAGDESLTGTLAWIEPADGLSA